MYYPNRPVLDPTTRFNSFGGIAGKSVGLSALIADCTAVVTLHARIDVGGIVGFMDGALVRNCAASVDLLAYEHVGGIVGAGVYDVQIIGCRTADRVSGGNVLGGIVGYFLDGVIEERGSDATVTGWPWENGLEIGGLAGAVHGESVRITRA
jgi:hypothetical protein